MQIADQFADDVLHDALVAIVAHAGHHDASLARAADVDIGALLGIQAAAHTDVAQGRAGFDDRFFDAAGIAEQHGVSIADAADDFCLILRQAVI